MKKLTPHFIFIILSLLLIKAGYSQQSWDIKSEPTIYQGRTVVEEVYSSALEGNLQGNFSTQPVKVYLPPGYDNFPSNKYPVVYLLHGYPGWINEFDPMEVVDDLISRNLLIPMIIVIPQGSTPYGGSWFTNSYVSGNWEDYIVQDVIQHIEGNYRVLDRSEYRGLGGYSHGGYGTINIAMKNPSIFNSIGLKAGALLDFTELLIKEGPMKEHMLTAAENGRYRPTDDSRVRGLWGCAGAFAPDSMDENLCKLPYNSEGILIDSIWQKWLKHDPVSMLQTYKDSLLKLDSIQIYTGEEDYEFHPSNETFHQALWDHGINHGYDDQSGGHNVVGTVKLLTLFSENLVGIVPKVRRTSDDYIEIGDRLVVESNYDGKLYVVPLFAGMAIDSIQKYKVATADVLAHEGIEIDLTGVEFGKYRVFAESDEGMVSNIPEEFYLVPDKSRPVLNLVNDIVSLGDSISVSISRDGSICLHNYPLFGLDTLTTASELLNSLGLRDIANVLADSVVSFSTEGLSTNLYWIYGFDEYGIVTGPLPVFVTSTVPITDITPDIKLFPNPTNDLLTVQTNDPSQYTILITSLNGQLLNSDIIEGPIFQIDLSSYNKGAYIITVRSESFIAVRKIIKL